MRKILFTFCAAFAIVLITGLQACHKKSSETDSGSSSNTSATITGLTCGSATYSGTAYASTAFTGTATVPYSGGNGATYGAGTAISSTGVTGLTATLQAGTLSSGAGNLIYTVAGTPSGSGTATFAITFGGQTCSFSMAVSAAAATTGCSTSSTVAAKVLCAVQAFEATLSATQLANVQFSYTSTNAIKWSNLPCGSSCRIGLETSTLTSTQLAAAMAVVAAATGTDTNQGYNEVTQIMAADDILKASAGGGYGSGNYFIAFVGTPSITGTWQLEFGGHHLAINRTFSNGTETGPTPYFIGLEPTSWTSNGTTYAPLEDKHAAMQNLLGSLSSTQLASAKLTSTFSDVVLGPGNDGKFPSTKVGIAVSSLSAAQQAYVLAAIKEWTDDLDAATAASVLATYQSELSNTYVAYSGKGNSSATAGSASTFLTTNTDYVRIDGPSVWIEFICQTGVVYSTKIHYHTIWRDHTRDYGNNFTF